MKTSFCMIRRRCKLFLAIFLVFIATILTVASPAWTAQKVDETPPAGEEAAQIVIDETADEVAPTLTPAQRDELARQAALREKERKEAEAQARQVAAEKARLDAEEKTRRDAEERSRLLREEAEKARLQAEQTAESALWDEAFKQNESELSTVEIEVDGLFKNVTGIIRPMRQGLQPLQEAATRLFSLATTHKDNPMMLEAVDRRGVILGLDLRRQTQPVRTTLSLVSGLNETLAQLRRSLPGFKQAEGQSQPALTPAQRESVSRVKRAESKLASVESRLKEALAPADDLQGRLDKMHTQIGAYLPSLWKRYYLDMPSRFFDPAVWQNSAALWNKTLNNMALRLSIEMPHTKTSWQGFGLRFLNIFLVGSIVVFFAHRYLRAHCTADTPRAAKNTFRCLLTLLLGLSMLGAAVGTGGEMFRSLMVLGSLIFISGEIGLAWEVRRLALKNDTTGQPLWPLYLTTLFGTALSYPDLPDGILCLSWLIFSAVLLVMLRWRVGRNTMPQLENSLFQTHHIAVWVSMGLAVIGWARMSILFLLTVNCLLVSIQLIVGTFQLIDHNEERGEQRSVIAAILAACIAPTGLLLVLSSATLWAIALPGGAKLLWFYLESGVQVGSASFNMLHLLLTISGFYLTRAAIIAGHSFVQRVSARSQRLDTSLVPPLQTGITYGMWALFGLFTLQSLGFGVANLAVIAGGLSVGIGFGMQAIVNNFISGLILIFSRTLHEGDIVDVGGVQGTIRKINVRATTVQTFENALIFVPNSEFVSNRLVNWTRNGRMVRRSLTVGVAYGTTPELVDSLLLQVANKHPLVQAHPLPVVLFADFADSTLNFTLRYWADFNSEPVLSSELRHEIVRVFNAHDIQIAFPQLDVHLIPPAAPTGEAAT